MAFDEQGWVREASDTFKQWREYCRAVAKGSARTPEELFVARQVGHPSSRVLTVVDPDTQHVSVLGVGIYPQLRELHRLALHAYRSGLGDVLFPPLTVRLGGNETRFRYAGYAGILAFADLGVPPRSRERAVVLGTSPSGFLLAAIYERREVVIARGRLREIAGLDLDRMQIWDRLPPKDGQIARIPSSDLKYMPAAFSAPNERGTMGPVRRKSRGVPFDEDPARLEATLVAALRASIVDEVPIGTRGRRELGDFLVDIVRLAIRGEPDLTGSAREIAERMGRALGQPPRSSRSTNTCLALLVEHGERHAREVIVSQPSPHRWTLHLTEIVNEDGGVRASIFSRWSTLHAVLVGDHEPVSEEDVTRMVIRGGVAGAVVKKRSEIPYMFDAGMVSEYNLRLERERELTQLRIHHAEELRVFAEELAQARRERDQAVAENAERAAQVAASDARLDRMLEGAAAEFQRLRTLMSQAEVHDGNKATVRALHRALDCRDWSTVEALLAPGFVCHDDAGGESGEGLGFVDRLRESAGDRPAEMADFDLLVAEADLVAVHLSRGVGAAPSRASTQGTVRIYRVVDNKITEAWGWLISHPRLPSLVAHVIDDVPGIDEADGALDGQE